MYIMYVILLKYTLTCGRNIKYMIDSNMQMCQHKRKPAIKMIPHHFLIIMNLAI